jgi:hypothetical protein
MGHRWQIHKDGSFYTTQKGPEDSGIPSKDIRLWNLEVLRHSDRYHLGPQLPFHFDQMETISRYPWGMTPNEYVFPSIDRWSDRKNQPNDRSILMVIHKLWNGQLGRAPTHGRVCLQQCSHPSHQHITLLCQLWLTPRMYKSKHYTNEW